MVKLKSEIIHHLYEFYLLAKVVLEGLYNMHDVVFEPVLL